jgi:6-pyruvoyltetrahydropterin/6-carboxytetrahydropterin synthase
MYYLKKTMIVSGAHKLDLPYESACKTLHGHNWKITLYFKSAQLNDEGMIIDFVDIKSQVNKLLDHTEIELPQKSNWQRLNPTAENIAKCLCDIWVSCYRVEVEETPGNVAIYEEY